MGSLRSARYFKATLLLTVRDFEYIWETNIDDLPSYLTLIMAGLIFFDIISSLEISFIFFEISFGSTIFVSSHVFSDWCFLMFLQTSVFQWVLVLRSSTSVSNWWIVIASLITASFSSANLNFNPSISSLFSRAYLLTEKT